MPPQEPRLQHGYGKIGKNILKTYQSNWIISTGRGENKNYLKPPPRIHDRNTPIKGNNPFHQPGSCFSVKPGNIIRQCLALPPCWDPFFLEGARNSQHYAGCRLTLAARGYIHIIIFIIIHISVHIYMRVLKMNKCIHKKSIFGAYRIFHIQFCSTCLVSWKYIIILIYVLLRIHCQTSRFITADAILMVV